MNTEPLDLLPLWSLVLITAALTGLAMEGGYRVGRRRHAHAAEEKDTPVGAMVGSILGLLAFLLAFTFSLAATRFDDRRRVILDEANAIGTTYLRARLLPEPQRSEAAALLREYVDVRLPDISRGDASAIVAQAIRRSEALQEALWARATAAAETKPTPITGLFVVSLNEMIDIHAKRVFASVRSRIPISIWAGLFTLALLGMAAVGYQAGLAATRRSPAMLGMVIAFGGVLFLIADLDRGHEGFLTVSRQALIDLQQSLKSPTP